MFSLNHLFLSAVVFLSIFHFIKADNDCHTSDDCTDFHICEKNTCVHKDLFPMSLFPEVAAVVAMTIIGGILNTGGSGGGALLSSILIIVFNYSSKDAIALVYSLLFGGNLGNFINIARRRDKITGKPLVNYDLVLTCAPSMLFGATLGVLLNRAVAPIFILIGTIFVIGYPMKQVYLKARKLYAEETVNNSIQNSLQGLNNDHLDNTKSYTFNDKSMSEKSISDIIPLETEIADINKMEHSLIPCKKIALLLLLVLSMMTLALFRGTNNVPSIIGITYCSPGYWGLFGAALLICLTLLMINKRFLRSIESQKKRHNIPTTDVNDLEIRQMMRLSAVSLVAGILAGLLGIGGGILLSPTMLGMGVRPQVVTATSGFFIMQTSMISLFESALYGDVPLSNQLFFVGTSFIGSYTISLILSWIISRTKRDSILLYTLFVVTVLCLVTVPALEIWRKTMGSTKKCSPLVPFAKK